jgi:alkylation response protein AidB-like acyl-CoA dehydrogenase
MTTLERAGLDDETLDFVLQSLKTVAERRLGKEIRLGLDDRHEFPTELIQEMLGPELGLHLLFLPEEVGGMGGGARDLFRASEELARIDLGVATAFLAIALGVDPIRVGGTEAQRARWLGRIAEEGLIVAYGVTEPAAGSDVAKLRTVAEPVEGPDGAVTAYRLSGTKQFITNGGVAQIYTILARAPGGPSFFVVERDTPGLSVGADEHKHGIRASNTTQVVLEDVMVPAENLLGLEEGRGLSQANQVFGFTRLMVAAFGLGAGEEALERAVRYSDERLQFGEPLHRNQGFTHKLLVPHAVRLEASRAFCEAVALRLDQGESGLQVDGSVAKLFATETGNAAADAAIQAHGGYGYTQEYEVEKIRRDVRITTIYEGTSEIQQGIIGTHSWRATVRTKGGFYRDMADALRAMQEARDEGAPGCGLAEAALAASALAELFLACHSRKLPRQQIILFELARLATEVETAVELSRKAAGREDALLTGCARLHAGSAARAVVTTGLHVLLSSGGFTLDEVGELRRSMALDAILASSAGELQIMSAVADELVRRVLAG